MKRFESKKDIKILYMGTPEISARVFKDLIDDGFTFVGLITNEDKLVGRKKILTPTPTKVIALEHNIKVYQPKKIRLDYEFLKEIDFDILLTMAYGQIVPDEVLAMAKVGAINLHGSLLPEYRGAAPIQRAIMDGKKVSGVTLMKMVAKMDAGTMYDKEEVTIEDDDNYSSLAIKISIAASRIAKRSLLDYANGLIKGEEQDENLVTFAAKIKPEDEHLSLELGCNDFINYVRGLSLTPGAYLYLEGKKLKIFKASKYSDKVSDDLGKIVLDKKKLVIQLKDGQVSLDYLQLEGKKEMDAASFLNGMHNLLGKQLV